MKGSEELVGSKGHLNRSARRKDLSERSDFQEESHCGIASWGGKGKVSASSRGGRDFMRTPFVERLTCTGRLARMSYLREGKRSGGKD